MESDRALRRDAHSLFEREFYSMLDTHEGRVRYDGLKGLEKALISGVFDGDIRGDSPGNDALSFAISKYFDYIFSVEAKSKTAETFKTIIATLCQKLGSSGGLPDAAIATFLAHDFLAFCKSEKFASKSADKLYLGLFDDEGRRVIFDNSAMAKSGKDEVILDYEVFRGSDVYTIKRYFDLMKGSLAGRGLKVGIYCSNLASAEEMLCVDTMETGEVEGVFKMLSEGVSENSSGRMESCIGYGGANLFIIIGLRKKEEIVERLREITRDRLSLYDSDSESIISEVGSTSSVSIGDGSDRDSNTPIKSSPEEKMSPSRSPSPKPIAIQFPIPGVTF